MKLFITGIGTDVGKPLHQPLSEALEADYWKPIQGRLRKF
jgi:dethiobiotin synthetase